MRRYPPSQNQTRPYLAASPYTLHRCTAMPRRSLPLGQCSSVFEYVAHAGYQSIRCGMSRPRFRPGCARNRTRRPNSHPHPRPQRIKQLQAAPRCTHRIKRNRVTRPHPRHTSRTRTRTRHSHPHPIHPAQPTHRAVGPPVGHGAASARHSPQPQPATAPAPLRRWTRRRLPSVLGRNRVLLSPQLGRNRRWSADAGIVLTCRVISVASYRPRLR